VCKLGVVELDLEFTTQHVRPRRARVQRHRRSDSGQQRAHRRGDQIETAAQTVKSLPAAARDRIRILI